MTSTIKKCPFCGGMAALREYPFDANDEFSSETKRYSVGCDNEKCGVSPETPYYHKKAALDAWNKRASPENDKLEILEAIKHLLRAVQTDSIQTLPDTKDNLITFWNNRIPD